MRGGSKPGERRGGRKAGTPNKLKAEAVTELRRLAQKHAPECIAELARLAREAQSEAARISAIGMLLDRGYGKAPQPLEHSGEMKITHEAALAELE